MAIPSHKKNKKDNKPSAKSSIVRVAGMWELGWNAPISEIELWRLMLRDFGVDTFYMTPVSGIKSGHVIERSSLEEVIKESDANNLQVVFVDERAETELSDFKHPKNALYIFGKANFSPLLGLKRDGDLSVKIATKENKGLLWPHQAAGIILYHRLWQLP